jgi:tripartite ATP-independent transporter DctM subunit
MDWVPLISMFGILFIFLVIGVPVAFAFGLANVLTILLFVGPKYSSLLVSGSFSNISNFLFLAFPLFILMGECFNRSGIAEVLVRILLSWLRWIPGAMGVVVVIGNTIFGALSGSSMAACAAFGTTMIPVMLKRGYSIEMSTGLIAFSGVMSPLIPPSAMVVIYGSLANVSIGKLLIGGITPGVLLALLGCIYLIGLSKFRPQAYDKQKDEMADISFLKLFLETIKYFLPLSFVIMAVTVSIYMGIATPSEAAAMGCLVAVIVIVLYGKINFWKLNSALRETMITTAMCFFIIVGSATFSQLLFLTGTTQKVLQIVMKIHVSPIVIALCMLIIVLILGSFIDTISIMFITLPIFKPLANNLGFDEIWFGLIYLYCIILGSITPPFGVNLFVTQVVSPPGTTLQHVYRGIYPFVFISFVLIPLFLFAPGILTYLPNKMLGK